MPLTPCPACEREVSDAASICPHCGRLTQPDRERLTKKLLKAYNIGCLLVIALLAVAFGYWLVGMVS